MPKRYKKSIIQAAIDQLDLVRELWLNRPGVAGVDVGYRLENGHITDELALRVHVERKLPNSALDPGYSFSLHGDSSLLGDFRIDVIEAAYAPANEITTIPPEEIQRTGRVEPLVGGISVGNARVSAGTLGAIVWDKKTGSPCILSNWHVLCGSNACRTGEAIYQPAALDGGDEEDKVAELLRWQLDSFGDAALARLSNSREFARDLLELNPITGIDDEPRLGQLLTKSGRTTGVTEGIIDGVSLSLSLQYENGPRVLFNDQLRIVPRAPWPGVDYELSRGGDSGSIWVSESSNRAVGLHFAGERDPRPVAEYAAASRMDIMAQQLEFSVQPVFINPRTSTRPGARKPDPVMAPQPSKQPAGSDFWRTTLRRILCQAFPPLCDPNRSVSFGDQFDLESVDMEAVVEAILDELNQE